MQLNNSWIVRFLRSRTGMMLTCTSYVAVFVLVYERVIVPLWGYEGFYSRATPERAAIGWVLAVLPSLWMPINLKRPSQVAYWLLYVLVVVPVCLIPIYALEDQSSGPVMFAASVVGTFALTGVIYCLPLASLPRMHLESYEFMVLLTLMSITFYALMIASFGFHLRYVSFEDIYSVRAEYTATLNRAPRLVAYAIGWQAWVINPFMIAMGLRSRRVSWFLAGAAGEFAIYSITAFRSMFFAVGLLIYLLWAMRSTQAFGIRLAGSWTAIFMGTGALQLLGYGLIPISLVGERMTGMPGLLTGYYYEYFSWHPQVHLGHSILKSLVSYPYAVEPAYIIGSLYFHGVDANANVWADAYANFGYVGIFCFTLLLAIVLWLYDSMAVDRDMRFAALVIGLPAFALANGGLLTCLLSNGMALAMLLVYLVPSTIYEKARGPVAKEAATRGRLANCEVSKAPH